jgi:hypothetical protein
MNLTVLKVNPAGNLVDPDGRPVKQKRSVVRNLGRLEQIFSCAERLLTRSDPDDCLQAADTQGEIKKA